MADKILKQNKIPGCERLTRPEEIKALSKYLRHIKRDLENRTDLEETTLEIPGKTTGQFHDVSELPTEYDKLDSGNSIQHLSNERVGLESAVDNINLEDHKEKLENTLDPELSDYRENLEDTREPNLSTYKENLEDTRDLELSDHKETIENSKETELEDHKEKLENTLDPKLSDYRENLEDTRDLELSDHKELLSEFNEVESLYDSIIGLENILEPKLSDYKDTIEDNRNTNLEDYREDLENTKDLELSDHKESIVDEREPELSDYKETIENTTDPELSDYKDSIVDEREPELENKKETIENLKEPELSNFKDTIVDDKELNSIPNFKDKIFNEHEISLGDYKDSIIDERELELGNYKDSILDERNPELEDYKDSIVDEREPELENYKGPLGEINEVESLYDSAIGLDDFRNPELEDYKDSIVDERNPELSNFKDIIQDDNEPSLEDYINQLDEGEFKNPVKPNTNLPLNQGEFKNPVKPTNNLKRPANENPIFNNEWNTDGSPGYYGSWDDVLPKLVDDRNPELEDTVILKDATYNPETSTFSTDGLARVDDGYDYIDNSIDYDNADPIIQQKAKQKFERHQKVLEKPESENQIFNNEWNTDGSPGYYNSWNDVLPKLVDEREPELEDTVIKKETIYNPETGTLGTDGLPRTDGDYDYIDNESIKDYNEVDPIILQKAKQKFERHQEVLERPESENPDPLYETLRNLDDKELYNFILQILSERDNDSDLVIDSEWKEKIAALVSTYLNPGKENKPISPRNAHRFEDELFRGIRLVGSDEEIEGSLSRNSDGTGRIDGEYDFIDGTSTTKAQVKEHTEDDYKDVPFMQIPEDSTIFDKVEYIRYAAENIVGWTGIGNDRLRKFLLMETLWALVLARRGVERTTGVNRDRLPGRQGGVGTFVDDANTLYEAYQNGNLINSAIGLLSKYLREKPNPINRPRVDELGRPKNKTEGFELGNNRYEANRKKGIAGALENLWNNIENIANGGYNYDQPYNFKDHYLKGGGIATTLSDLCEGKTPESVEDLLEIFKNSEYITTPTKFGTIHEGSYGTQTLDSNSYWEVVIEPFCDDYLNGGYSYLPCFNEINVINYASHGVKTAFNKWVPISNFELQKSKLTTKSIGLFDGEFSIPLSAELTNEIRFTIVDDQYKSWRNYFQKCMDVAVYNSEPHNSDFYSQFNFSDYITNGGAEELVTAVDKSIITVALYKNITFRIRIYIMTPQYSTIRRFDLLCVLKDFIEEYSGDIDSGGVDLNVTFSIVGENPNSADQEGARVKDWFIGLVNREDNPTTLIPTLPSLTPGTFGG